MLMLTKVLRYGRIMGQIQLSVPQGKSMLERGRKKGGERRRGERWIGGEQMKFAEATAAEGD